MYNELNGYDIHSQKITDRLKEDISNTYNQ